MDDSTAACAIQRAPVLPTTCLRATALLLLALPPLAAAASDDPIQPLACIDPAAASSPVRCTTDHDPGTLPDPAPGRRITDYRSIETPLTLSRHGVATPTARAGWQHSYALRLWQADHNALLLQLADARSVRFEQAAGQPQRFIASATIGAGEIQHLPDGYHWLAADGRDMRFQGSLPASIHYPDGARLDLHYRQGRLQSVTDHHGQRITFAYDRHDARTGRMQPSATVLPDGTRLELPPALAPARATPPPHGSTRPPSPAAPGNALLDAVRAELGPAHSLTISASADGRLHDVLLDDVAISERLARALARRIEAGEPLTCDDETAHDANRDDGSGIASLMNRLLEGTPICLADAERYVLWAQAIEDNARQRPGGLRAPTHRKRADFSCLPDYKTCDELKENLRRAELAACIYSGGTCPAGWRPVKPASLGIDDAYFQSRYFQTGLFHHPGDNLYVLAFRGTDEGFDWFDNGFNAMGIPANQYARATKLAGKVAEALQATHPGATLEYTGHSLGGGLATVAALSTGQHATVFNPASLHANQARWLGVSLDDAGYLVDVLTLGGDIVTRLQRIVSAIRFVLGVPERIGVAGDAPGRHSRLPRPDAAWISQYRLSLGHDISMTEILHSMAAMLASMRRLINTHCRTTP